MEHALRLESELVMSFRHVAVARKAARDILIRKYPIPQKAAREYGARLEAGCRDEVTVLVAKG